MQKLIARMKNEVERSPFKKPALQLIVQDSSKSEAYELTYRASELILRAEGERGALLGLHHLLCAEERWPEFLGRQLPKVGLRALLVEGDEIGVVGDLSFCSYPKKALEDPEEFLYFLYRNGFNTVIFGGKKGVSQKPFPKFPFPVIMKPHFDAAISYSPLDERHRERVKPLKNSLFESLCGEPSFLSHPKTRDFTRRELLIKEAHLAPTNFYHCESADLYLLDELEKGVTCVVSAKSPLLEQLRCEPHPSQTPLVVIGDHHLFSRTARIPLVGMIVKEEALHLTTFPLHSCSYERA